MSDDINVKVVLKIEIVIGVLSSKSRWRGVACHLGGGCGDIAGCHCWVPGVLATCWVPSGCHLPLHRQLWVDANFCVIAGCDIGVSCLGAMLKLFGVACFGCYVGRYWCQAWVACLAARSLEGVAQRCR